MGSKGDCYDNAVCESFHATLEKELLRSRSFKTRQEAKTAIFDWIEAWYNPARRYPLPRLPLTRPVRRSS